MHHNIAVMAEGKLFFTIFNLAPCDLISSKTFIYQQMHFISVLENTKIYIKTYIRIAPTCFGLRPSSGSLHLSLTTVTFIKIISKVRHIFINSGTLPRFHYDKLMYLA
jgi:hypothetical protein